MRKTLGFIIVTVIVLATVLPSSIEKYLGNSLIFIVSISQLLVIKLRYRFLLYLLLLVSPIYLVDPIAYVYLLALIFGLNDWSSYRIIFAFLAFVIGLQLMAGNLLTELASLVTVDGFRLKTSFGDPNSSGLFIIASSIIVLKDTWKIRIDFASILALAALCLAHFSLSRTTSLMSLVLMMVFLYPLIRFRLVVLPVVVFLFYILFGKSIVVTNLLSRFTGETSYQSNFERINRASRGWEIYRDSNVFGLIKGRGLWSNQTEFLGELNYTLIPTHNTWLNILIELGLLGFIIFGVLFVFKLRRAKNFFHKVAIFGVFVLIMNTENLMANYILFLLLL